MQRSFSQTANFLINIQRENRVVLWRIIYNQLGFLKFSVEEINFEDGEAQEAKWVTIEEFIKMFEEGEIVYNVNFDKNDYEKCLQLLNNNEKSLK